MLFLFLCYILFMYTMVYLQYIYAIQLFTFCLSFLYFKDLTHLMFYDYDKVSGKFEWVQISYHIRFFYA
jgi:hypothetical protein